MNDPVRFKLDEARYFLQRLRDNSSVDPYRKYYLDAFLASARSVEYFLRYKYRDQSGFTEWITAKMDEWVDDEELGYLVRGRNQSIHKEPIATETVATQRLAHGLALRKADDEFPIRVEPDVQLGKATAGSRIVSWTFPELKNREVVAFCERQLDKLDRVDQECKHIFG